MNISLRLCLPGFFHENENVEIAMFPNCGFWNILLENFNRYGIEKGLIDHICLGNTVFYILSWKFTVHIYKLNSK